MRALISLFLLLTVAAAVYAVRSAVDEAARGPLTLMLVGLVMLAAWLAGRLFDRVNLPKIRGYLVLGVLIGPRVFKLIPTQPALDDLSFANDLAIALIALVAGGEIELRWLRGQLTRMAILIASHVGIVVVGSIAFIIMVQPFVPVMREFDTVTTAVVAMLVGVVMIASSPAVIVAMISDCRAAGSLTQTTLVVTVMKDLVLVVLFAPQGLYGLGARLLRRRATNG